MLFRSSVLPCVVEDSGYVQFAAWMSAASYHLSPRDAPRAKTADHLRTNFVHRLTVSQVGCSMYTLFRTIFQVSLILAGIMDDRILPSNGSTVTAIPDGSHSVLNFASSGIRQYQIDHNITETDGTFTLLMTTVNFRITTFICQVHPSDITITQEQSMGKNVVNLNGEFLFLFDSIETETVLFGEMVAYENSTVTILRLNTETKFPNISTFWYCDSFRCYEFNSSKSSFIRSGPTGKLFTSNDVALYSIAGLVNSRIEDLLILSPVPTTTMISSPTSLMLSSVFSTSSIAVPTSVFSSSLSTFTIVPSLTPSPTLVMSTSVAPSVSTFIQTLATPTPTPGPQSDIKPIVCEKTAKLRTKSRTKSRTLRKSRSSRTKTTVKKTRKISGGTRTRTRGTTKTTITKTKHTKHTWHTDDRERTRTEVSTRMSSTTADSTDMTKVLTHAYTPKRSRVTRLTRRPGTRSRPTYMYYSCRKKAHNHVAKPKRLKTRKSDAAATTKRASNTHRNRVAKWQRNRDGSHSDKTPKPTVQNKLRALLLESKQLHERRLYDPYPSTDEKDLTDRSTTKHKEMVVTTES